MSQTHVKLLAVACAGALALGLRVKFDGSGNLVVAGAADLELGTLRDPAFKAGDVRSIFLRISEETAIMVAAGPIAKAGDVWAAAGGKVDATGTVLIGTALEAATADGDRIEVLRKGPTAITTSAGTTAEVFTVDSDSAGAMLALDTNGATGNFTASLSPQNLTGNIRILLPAAAGTLATLAGTETFTNKTFTSPVLNTPTVKNANAAKTGDFTVTAALTGTTFTTVGAGGIVVFALPAAVVGLKYRFSCEAAFALKIDPNGVETIALPSTGAQGAAGKELICATAPGTVELECTKAGQWSVFGYTGTWTAEA